MPRSRFFVRLFARLLCASLAVAQPALGQSGGSGGTNRPEHRDKPYVILVSLDGFKPEYLDRFAVPNLRRVADRGARARWMRPVFPSLTFPNHFSLVTGMYPATHGIVSNRFYDPAFQDTYVYNDNDLVVQGRWYAGEPIWVTAEKQGMVSACFFWPGSEAPIQGVRPTIYKTYSSQVPNDARVDTVLDWLRMPIDRRPHVITLYFSEMDTASHTRSLQAPEIEQAARSLDATIGRLLDGIDALPIRDQVYLLLTSDHGMVSTSGARAVQLTSLLNSADIARLVAAFSGPVANLHVRGGAAEAIEIRDKINAGLRHGTAYLRTELPERFHYRTNPRAGNVVVVMDESWSLNAPRLQPTVPRLTAPPKPEAPRPQREEQDEWGAHGWDNQLPSMRALFVVMGPTIRPHAVVDEVENIDVYPFIAEVLGLTPAPGIDGRARRIGDMIRK